MAGTSAADGYGQAAASMGAAGIGGVGGTGASGNRGNSGGKGGGKGGGGGGRAGGVGSPGVGGGFDGNSKGTSAAEGYGQAAESMGAAGVGGVGGTGASGNRGSDNASSGGGGGGRAGGVGTPGVGGGFDGATQSDRNSGYADIGMAGSVGSYTNAMGGPGALAAGSTGLYSSAVNGTGFEAALAANGANARQAEVQSLKDMAMESLLGTVRSVEAHKRDPYNSLVYGVRKNTPTHANLTDMTIEEVQQFQKGMIRAGHASTAVGAYQTKASTLDYAVKALGLDPKTTKFDEATQDLIGKALVENRARQATVNGVIDLDKFADRLTKEWASLPDATGKSAYDGIAGNKASKSVSHAGLRDLAAGIINGQAVQGDFNVASKTPATTTAETPKSNLSAAAKEYQYAGVTKAAAPTDVAKYAYTSRFRDMYISPHYTLEQQGLTQDDLDRQTPEVDRADITPGQKAEVGAAQQNASVGQPSASQQAAANAPTSNTAPANAPTGQPANPTVTDTPATQPDEATTEQKRGTGAQVVAGGIDVLAGMIPGIGIGASVFNAGAALTGNRTIGERLVDDFASGDNPGGPVTSREADSLLERETQTHGGSKVDSTASDEAAPAKDVDRFVRLYLQTPTEKWGRTKGLMTASA